MVRAAALVAGDGAKLQGLLDAVYFNEIPNLELTAVISCEKNSNAMKRATSAGVPAYMVDPDLFPTSASYTTAISNKLQDMDIDLVLLAGYNRDLGVLPRHYRNRIIGTFPSLIPAFDAEDIYRAALERGLKLTGATAYFADVDGTVGYIILQKEVPVNTDDTPASLAERIMHDAETPLLVASAALFANGRLSLHGNRVVIAEQ